MNTEQVLQKILNLLTDGTQETQITDGTNVLGTTAYPVVVNPEALSYLVDGVSIIPMISAVQTLQGAGSGNGNGTALTIGQYSEMVVSIVPTSGVTAGTVTFQTSDSAGNWTNLVSYCKVDGRFVVSTTTAIGGVTEKWILPIEGDNQVRAVISGIAGTSATYTITGLMRG